MRTRSSGSFKASMTGSTDPVRPCWTQASNARSRTCTSGDWSAVAIRSAGGEDATPPCPAGAQSLERHPARPTDQGHSHRVWTSVRNSSLPRLCMARHLAVQYRHSRSLEIATNIISLCQRGSTPVTRTFLTASQVPRTTVAECPCVVMKFGAEGNEIRR